VAGLREAVVTGRAPVVGVSPIIGDSPVRGMADKCLAALDVPCTAGGVGRLLGARSERGVLDAWLVDPVDAGADVPGVRVIEAPLWMTDESATVAMVEACLAAAGA
jgi:LPPG:FO 2-phospho-L-lactate transferase